MRHDAAIDRLPRHRGIPALDERRVRGDGRASGAYSRIRIGPRIKEILALAEDLGLRIDRVSKAELYRLAPGNRGIALEAEEGQAAEEADLDTFLARPSRELPRPPPRPHRGPAEPWRDTALGRRLRGRPRNRAAQALGPLGERGGKGLGGSGGLCALRPRAQPRRGAAQAEAGRLLALRGRHGGLSLPDADISARSGLVLGNEGSGVRAFSRTSATSRFRYRWPAMWIRSTYRPPRPC